MEMCHFCTVLLMIWIFAINHAWTGMCNNNKWVPSFCDIVNGTSSENEKNCKTHDQTIGDICQNLTTSTDEKLEKKLCYVRFIELLCRTRLIGDSGCGTADSTPCEVNSSAIPNDNKTCTWLPVICSRIYNRASPEPEENNCSCIDTMRNFCDEWPSPCGESTTELSTSTTTVTETSTGTSTSASDNDAPAELTDFPVTMLAIVASSGGVVVGAVLVIMVVCVRRYCGSKKVDDNTYKNGNVSRPTCSAQTASNKTYTLNAATAAFTTDKVILGVTTADPANDGYSDIKDVRSSVYIGHYNTIDYRSLGRGEKPDNKYEEITEQMLNFRPKPANQATTANDKQAYSELGAHSKQEHTYAKLAEGYTQNIDTNLRNDTNHSNDDNSAVNVTHIADGITNSLGNKQDISNPYYVLKRLSKLSESEKGAGSPENADETTCDGKHFLEGIKGLEMEKKDRVSAASSSTESVRDSGYYFKLEKQSEKPEEE